jgi:serine/threonine protein kinase
MQRFEPISHTHPGLIRILHVGKDDTLGCFYCVMEAADDLLGGQQIDPSSYVAKTLSKVMQQVSRPLFDDCLRIGLSLASAMGHLHQHGLIHRDIKPANIIFVNGVPKLADVGLVTAVSEGATVVGSTGYMPPEGPGRPVGDIYSLGILLYELFTRKSCLDFPELPTALQQIEATPQLLQVYKIILKACDSDARKRCQSAEELQMALAALLPGATAPATAQPARKMPRPDHPAPVSGQPDGVPLPSSSKLVAITHKANAQPDARLAGLLRDRLIRHGHRVFLDSEMRAGLHWAREIEHRIREADAVIVLLSAASLRSEMLAYELEVARNAAGQCGTPVLLPVRVALTGSLTEPLPSIQNQFPPCQWEGPLDDDPLLNHLLRLLENPRAGTIPPP